MPAVQPQGLARLRRLSEMATDLVLPPIPRRSAGRVPLPFMATWLAASYSN
jgi:hypothetical protein